VGFRKYAHFCGKFTERVTDVAETLQALMLPVVLFDECHGYFTGFDVTDCLLCFDAVGWAAGMASSL